MFNETVAIDLKEWTKAKDKTWFLHAVGQAARFSQLVVITSKGKEVIVRELFKMWIAIFGYPKKFFVDSGGEFHNDEFFDFCEKLNITIKTMAAENPWGNGLIERHNGIIGESVSKIMSHVNCSSELALSWAVSAKSSLQNVYGFSPNQLVFRRNPNFPSMLTDKRPALLKGESHSEMVASNLNAMHSARKAFIKKVSCEKIRIVLRHQTRASGNVKYITGDSVFYERNMSDKWKSPATVIGH